MTRSDSSSTFAFGRRIPFVAGPIAAALSAIGFVKTPAIAAGAWLWSLMFWLSIPLGCLAMLLIHVLTGGRWGDAIGRPAIAAARTLVWLPVAFAPIGLSLTKIYPWATGIAPESDQARWLNPKFVLLRAAIYFAIWIGTSLMLVRDWRRRIASLDAAWPRPQLAALLLIGFWLTTTFAAIDWMMSLELDWHSSIYGAQFGIGCILAGIAFLPACRRDDDASGDLGNMLLAAVMVWAYFAFSQFIIVWSGDLPHEATWYLRRSSGLWQALTVLTVLTGFAIPLAALLSRDVKTDARRLAVVALLVLAARTLESFWLLAPALPGRDGVHWLDVTCFVAIGGLWLSLFQWSLSRTPVMPLGHQPERASVRLSTNS